MKLFWAAYFVIIVFRMSLFPLEFFSQGYNLWKVKFEGISRQLFTTQSRLLTTVKQRGFENIVGKGENDDNHHFLLFPQCFLPFPSKIKGFWKCCRKRRKCWLQAFPPFFSECFLPFPNKNWIFHQHLFCHLQMFSFWTSLRFILFGKELNKNLSIQRQGLQINEHTENTLWKGENAVC